jgi:ribosomal protein L37AE/L43A
MGRRGIKEFRAPEALALVAADRDRKPLVCPSCGTETITRTPRRPPPNTPPEPGRIALLCSKCGRSAAYLARQPDPSRGPEAPYHPPHRTN